MAHVSHPQLLQRSVKHYSYLRTCLLLRLSLVVFVLLGVSTGAARADDAKQLFFEGFELLKAGKAKAAVAKFERGLKQEPNNAEAHFYLGEAYRTRKQVSKARQHYEASLKVDADSSVAAQARERLAAFTGAAGSGNAPATSKKNSDSQAVSTTFNEAATFIKQMLEVDGSCNTPFSDGTRNHSSSKVVEVDEVKKILTVKYEWLAVSSRMEIQSEGIEKIPFLELTSEIEVGKPVGESDGVTLKLICSSGKECIERKGRMYDSVTDKEVSSISDVKFSLVRRGHTEIEYCPDKPENIQRVKRALEHMLKVSGAKKSPF